MGQRNLSHFSKSSQPAFLLPFQTSQVKFRGPSAVSLSFRRCVPISSRDPGEGLFPGPRGRRASLVYRVYPGQGGHLFLILTTVLYVPVMDPSSRHPHPTFTPFQWGCGLRSTLVTCAKTFGATLPYNFQFLTTSYPQSR